MENEQIILELDSSQVIAGVDDANAAMGRFEKGAGFAAERAGEKFERTGSLMVRTSDRSRSSVERLVASLEKQAAVYGKTGVERLIAQRDQMIARLHGEESAIQRVTAAYSKMISAEQGGANGGSWQAFGRNIQQFVQNPLQTSSQAASGLFDRVGALGGALLGGSAALGAIAVSGYAAAKSLGEYADRIGDTSVRLGIGTKETGQFIFAMQRAGGDISSVEGIIRKLSQGLGDLGDEGRATREGLAQIGVATREVDGSVRPMSQVILELSERLGGISDPATRNATAIKIMGRSALEALPDLLELSAGVKRAKELGIGPSEAEIRQWDDYHKQVAEAEALWSSLARRLSTPLAAVINVVLRGSNSALRLLEGGQSQPLSISASGQLERVEDDGGPGFSRNKQNFGAGGGQYGPGYLIGLEMTRRRLGESGGRQIPASIQSFVEDANNKQAAESLAKFLRSNDSIAGAQAELKRLKGTYDEARTAAEQLATSGRALPEQASDFRKKLEQAGSAYRSQEATVKELERAESRRIALIEKEKDLVRDFVDQTRQKLMLVNNRLVVSSEFDQRLSKQTASQFDARVRLFNEQNPDRTPEGQAAALPFTNPQQFALLQRGMLMAQIRAATGKDLDATGKPVQGENFERQAAQTLAWWQRFSEDRQQEDTRRISALEREGRLQEQLVKLRIGPGGELAAIEETFQTRLSYAQKIYDVEKGIIGDTLAGYKLIEQQDQARIQRVTEIAALQRKQFDGLKDSIGGLIDAGISGAKSFGQAFTGMLRSALLAPLKEGLSTALAKTLQPIIYGQDGQGGIAGRLKGIFGKQADPVALSTDRNTTSTDRNSAAVDRLSTILTRSTGTASSGSGGGFSPASWAAGGAALGAVLASTQRTVGGEVLGAGGSTAGLSQLSSGLWRRGPGAGLDGAEMLGPGGTSGFAGPLGSLPGGGGSASPFSSAGLAAFAGPVASAAGLGLLSSGIRKKSAFSTIAGGGLLGAGIGLMGGPVGAVAGLGAGLAINGWQRGGWGGVGEMTAGGALIGLNVGGPIGAAIGAGIGFAVGLGKKLWGGDDDQTHTSKLIKQLYGVDIPKSSGTVKQIIEMAKQGFGGSISMAVRSPQARELIQLYSMSTGQKDGIFLNQPRAGSLVQNAAGLFQGPSYFNGGAYSFASSLPSLVSSSTIPTAAPQLGAGTIVLQVNGDSAAALLRGEAAGFMNDNPRAVSQAAYQGNQASSTRQAGAAQSFAPSVLLA